MNDEKNVKQTPENSSLNNSENTEEQTLSVKNPFDKSDDKKITQEDVENEQIFKEAQTERD